MTAKYATPIALALLLIFSPATLSARTIYKCWRDGTPSVSTHPEQGSKCTPEHIKDDRKTANAWQDLALHSGTLYSRTQGEETIYSTRNLPGSKPLFKFTVRDNKGRTAQEPTDLAGGRPYTARPRWGVFDQQFKQAAKKHNVEEAWLRAVAHAESGYASNALSPKGAMGVMQLMPETASLYGVKDPFAATQSINAGARHLAYLLRLYSGNKTLAAAAYNAGVGAVKRYKGVPPFNETREYVRRVDALYRAYQRP